MIYQDIYLGVSVCFISKSVRPLFLSYSFLRLCGAFSLVMDRSCKLSYECVQQLLARSNVSTCLQLLCAHVLQCFPRCMAVNLSSWSVLWRAWHFHSLRGEEGAFRGQSWSQTWDTAWLCTTRKAIVRFKKACNRAQQPSLSFLDTHLCELRRLYVCPSCLQPSCNQPA